ncbi:Conidiophore development regulator [Lachnellula occidentalis]|uniref:Conidiophore development regulator n=1 Tax=Lachnellula occidentalis TaxID=215460 RepID=A0A8H8RR94_9HELO|nr:Conidiophore development regulator [Lachnellula occidentalis]
MVPSSERRQRQQHNQRRRQQKYSRNPIVDSSLYRAYRDRQNKDGNPEDSKWPRQLEDAFLDALIDIPHMGRRKFSFGGRLHGRNELIREYLWIAYLQSLPPGQPPDMSMARTRKQVSSHIQVLKPFFKDHPAYERLFPPKKPAKNGFEDSFKNDPCLRALSQGRLPNKRYEQYNEISQRKTHYPPMKPTMFWLLITSITIESGRNTGEQDLYNEGIVLHKYTGLSAQRPRASLETIPNWRQRFPILSTARDLDCDIIHMDTSLSLMSTYPPGGAELVSRTELSIPGCELENCIWQINTSFTMPPALSRDPIIDPDEEWSSSINHVVSVTQDETRIKVPFPAKVWAHALTCLTDAQLRYEERKSYHPNSEPRKSAREYVDQISMYQAIQSSPSNGHPFETRAIILWTFRKASHGEPNATSWRYLDAAPPRRSVMSPSPHHSSQLSAIMHENFNAFVEPAHQPSMLDPFPAPLHSPFANQGYGYAAPTGFDMPPENLSFSSTVTADSVTSLVGDTDSNIDHYLANAVVNVNLDYNHDAHWHMPTSESFGEDPAWAYSVPSSTPQITWDVPSDAKIHEQWNEMEKPTWADDSTPTQKNEWEGSPDKHWAPELEADHISPVKQHDYEMEQSIEHSLEEKLRPWIDHHSNANANFAHGVSNSIIPHLEAIAEADSKETWGDVETREEGWVDGPGDDFDFARLAEQLK